MEGLRKTKPEFINAFTYCHEETPVILLVNATLQASPASMFWRQFPKTDV
jgi:hypothetical protein